MIGTMTNTVKKARLWACIALAIPACACGDDDAAPPASLQAHRAYAGVEAQAASLNVSDPSAAGGGAVGRYSSRLYDLRLGARLFPSLGVEAQAGLGDQQADAGHFKARSYFGLYAVPTANLFNRLELGFPVGYATLAVHLPSAAGGQASAQLHSLAYGANLELPLRPLLMQSFPQLPELRLSGGGMMFNQRSGARAYAFHLGLRYDFAL